MARPSYPIIELSACRHRLVTTAIDRLGARQCGAGSNRCCWRCGLGRRCLQGLEAIRACLRLRFEAGTDRNGERRRRLGAQAFRDALCQRVELHHSEVAQQCLGIGILHPERLDGDLKRYIVLQRHELTRDACLLGKLDELFATLRLLDLSCPGEQRIEIAISSDQLGRRLNADARDARHVVDRSRPPKPAHR